MITRLPGRWSGRVLQGLGGQAAGFGDGPFSAAVVTVHDELRYSLAHWLDAILDPGRLLSKASPRRSSRAVPQAFRPPEELVRQPEIEAVVAISRRQ